MWATDVLIEAVAAGIAARERQLALEHAVHGLDALEEVAWHPILAGALDAAELGTLREQPYPHEWRVKRGRGGRRAEDVPLPRDRMRCDLVLTPCRGQRVADPMALEAAAVKGRRAAQGTLFESRSSEAEHAARDAAIAAAADCCPPEDAYWLEVKLVAQHAYTAGIPGPNRTYASELRRTAADLGKLDEDERIRHAGLLVVMFTIDEATARHDLTELMHLCLDRGLAIGTPAIRCVPILERIGNRVCTVCLVDVRKLG